MDMGGCYIRGSFIVYDPVSYLHFFRRSFLRPVCWPFLQLLPRSFLQLFRWSFLPLAVFL